MSKNKKPAKQLFNINLDSSDSSDGYQTIDDMFPQDFGSSDSSLGSNPDKEKHTSKAQEIKRLSPTVRVFYNRKTGEMVQKAKDPISEKNFQQWLKNPLYKASTNMKMGRKSPDIPPEDYEKIREKEQLAKMSPIKKGWLEAVERSQSKKQKENKEYLEPLPKGWGGGRKTRKKFKRFRNNFRKNKISRKYIMLKQCGGGKAKMGSKSKPYSSKRKAMRSRRRVCYYKKKGRTLKLKKKSKKSKKKSRRRRRR